MRRVPRVCIAAALAAFAVVVAGAAAAEPIRVLTYNVGLLKVAGINFVPMVDARAKLAPREIARFAADADPALILLEEIWWDSYAQDIEKEMAPLGYAAVQPKLYSILGLNSGLLLLVKQPLAVVEWKFTPYARTTFVDGLARKGVLEAVIEDSRTGVRFAFIGTHTVAVETNNGQPKDKTQMNVIMAQIAQLVAALEARSAGGSLPVLALGDFNVGPGFADAAYREVASVKGMREAGEALFPGAPLVTWDPGNPLVKFGGYPEEPAAKIDHIFFRDGASLAWTPARARVVLTDPVEGLGASPLSDHYGFMAELELADVK
jgi:endonuclease/exonuclease/phosphatase family metal-dependent hydrolase